MIKFYCTTDHDWVAGVKRGDMGRYKVLHTLADDTLVIPGFEKDTLFLVRKRTDEDDDIYGNGNHKYHKELPFIVFECDQKPF